MVKVSTDFPESASLDKHRGNEVFGEEYIYSGNNVFSYPANPEGNFENFQFEFVASAIVKLTHSFDYGALGKGNEIYFKKLSW